MDTVDFNVTKTDNNMGIWSSIASAAKNQAVRKVGRFVTYPIVHPGRTLQGAGAATKTAVVGGGMGYLAWESIAMINQW